MPSNTQAADNRIAPPNSIWWPSGDADAPTGPRSPGVWNPFDMAGQRHLLPITAAILRALALPADTIMRTATQPPTDMVVIEVVIFRLVASAITGDTKAAALIADRVEGRVGLRPDNANCDDPACQQRVQAAIRTLVRFMVERAANSPSKSAASEAGPRALLPRKSIGPSQSSVEIPREVPRSRSPCVILESPT